MQEMQMCYFRFPEKYSKIKTRTKEQKNNSNLKSRVNSQSLYKYNRFLPHIKKSDLIKKIGDSCKRKLK